MKKDDDKDNSFRASMVYNIVIFLNAADVILEAALILSATHDYVIRIIMEGILIFFVAFLLVVCMAMLYDSVALHEGWSVVLSVNYEGYVLRYMLGNILGHALPFIFIMYLDITTSTPLTITEYDMIVIAISYTVAMVGILIKEKEVPKKHSVLPVVAEKKATPVQGGFVVDTAGDGFGNIFPGVTNRGATTSLFIR